MKKGILMNSTNQATEQTPCEQLIRDTAPKEFSIWGKLWTTVLVFIVLLGMYAYFQQLRQGLIITDMRDYAFWGVYISNFVFFVAISLVGSLVTAILRLSGVKWSIPLTRIAEIIAVSAIIMAGLTIIIDMGRPDSLYYLFIYGRFQSPIIWDVIVISTYLVISLLLLYFPLIPDFAILKNYFKKGSWMANMYKRLSLNWTGSAIQRLVQYRSIKALSILIIPIAFGIHTVTAWLFATTYRPGWDSTNFGPYFVSGAFVIGAAAVIALSYVLRKAYGLQNYIQDHHFDKMARLLVLLCSIYLYFNINEYLIPAYKVKKEEEELLHTLFFDKFSLMFWSAIFMGIIMPIIVLLFKKGRRPRIVFVVSVIVVVASWWKRYLIVTPTLLHPFLPIQGVPESWHDYYPTFLEWAVTYGTLAMALLITTFMVRYLPIIPIHEMAEYEGIKIHQIKEKES